MRTRVGLAFIIGSLLLTAVSAAGAASPAPAPRPGNWEGVGPHGLPMSFSLARHDGRLVATSLGVGYPASCPAVKRDAEAVPFRHPAYAGPGAGTASAVTAALSGRLARTSQPVVLTGAFKSPTAGTFSVRIGKMLGCGWPAKRLTWSVRRAARRRVADGTWTGPLLATGLINGHVRLVVSEHGRVIDSFTSFFTCQTDTQQGNTLFRAVPAFEFVRPGGTFYSPLDGGRVKGHPTTWRGRFSAAGTVTGTITIFDDCTSRLIQAGFSATRTKPA